MIACSYHELFPSIIDAIHEKWNTELNEKDEKLKKIKPDTRPGKKIIDVGRMKLLSPDSELAIRY